MKKILTTLLVLILSVTLLGCESQNDIEKTGQTLEEDGFKVYKLQASNPACIVFMNKEHGPAITFTIFNDTVAYISYIEGETERSLNWNEIEIASIIGDLAESHYEINEETRKLYQEYLTNKGYEEEDLIAYAEWYYGDLLERNPES